MLASGLSAYWNGREAADTAYDRTLLASARTIAAGLSQRDGSLSADVPYVASIPSLTTAPDALLPGQRHPSEVISGYENLPGHHPVRQELTAIRAGAFYNATYKGRTARGQSVKQ